MNLLKKKKDLDEKKEVSLSDEKDKLILKDDNKPIKNEKKKLKLDMNKIKAVMNLDVKDVKKMMNSFMKNNTYLKMPEKKKKVAAFDIGSKNIKIVEGMYYKNEISIDKCVKIKTPKDCVKDGEIVNKAALINCLKDTMNENSIKAKEGMCTNNSSLIINREIVIPKVKDEEIDTVVRFEIQQYLPINLDDFVLQMTVLGETEDNKMEVRVIAYPDKMARSYFDLLKDLNLKPYVLDVNYNALNKLTNYADSINKHKYDKKHTAVFIDMGAETLDVNIYNEGILRFTRIIKAGGNYLDEVIKNIDQLKDEEIEDYKINDINLSKDMIDLQEPQIVSEVDDWIEKIEKIIQFYKNKHKNDDIYKIFIYGGTAKIKGLSDYMTVKLAIDTEKIKFIPNIPLNSDKSDISMDDFINAAGCVMRV